MKLDSLFTLCHERIEKLFRTYLIEPNYPDRQLQQAMIYSIQNGGKRIRPLYVFAVGTLFDAPYENLDAAATAIELIHTYSLIHDDLPAMDNSDLRRGKPSCHKAYNEAAAILAGDALQPLAFEILAEHPSSLTEEERLKMIKVLSHASGVNGMATGQALDLAGVNSLETLDQMYQLKTGALLEASVQLGVIASKVRDAAIAEALKKHIHCIGLAFQIQDDLLDIQGDAKTTGKPQGIDASNQKITYPALLGIEQTKEKISILFERALSAIEFLGNNAEILRELAYYLLHRKK